MDIKEIMNSAGMWITSSVMVIIVLIQAILLFRLSLKRAKELGMKKEVITYTIKSATYTTLSPAFAMLIICISMIALYGGPTTWMRLNDVGAPRTELAVAEIAKTTLSADLDVSIKAIKEFSYGLWGMALNNVGWFVTALLFTKRMGKIVSRLDEKFDKVLVRMMMAAAMLGLYGSMLSINVIGKTRYHVVAAVVAGVIIIILDKVFGKYKTLQELSMGIALFIGIFAAEFSRSLF